MRAFFQEGSFTELGKSLAELLLCVHHDRTVPSHGFLEGLSRDQQESDSIISCLHHDLVTAIKQHERAVFCLAMKLLAVRDEGHLFW